MIGNTLLDISAVLVAGAIAQLDSVTATQLGAWLWCAAAVAVMFKLGLDIKNGWSGRAQARVIADQPLQVEQADRYVTAEFCEQSHRGTHEKIQILDRRVSVLESEIKEVREDIISAGDERARRLHERIDKMIESIGTKFEVVRADIGGLAGEIRRIGT